MPQKELGTLNICCIWLFLLSFIKASAYRLCGGVRCLRVLRGVEPAPDGIRCLKVLPLFDEFSLNLGTLRYVCYIKIRLCCFYMPAIHLAFEQIANLMAQLPPEALLQVKASPEMQERFERLMGQRRSGSLSQEETDELNHFIVLERLVRLAKIKADPSQQS